MIYRDPTPNSHRWLVPLLAAIILSALAALFLLSQFLNDLRPTWPQPDQETIIQGKRCAVYQSEWRAAPMFVVLCDDGTTTITRDWRYI